VTTPHSSRAFSVVIPAHNEELGLPGLLRLLVDPPSDALLDIVVVCNGCTDRTATVAREFGQAIRVVETPVPSKAAALKLGDSVAKYFPRVYVDADVLLDAKALATLVDALVGEVEASAPARVLDTSGSTLLVRMYYRFWQHLPQVQSGLFGRGVIALSAGGHERIARLPRVLADDLVVSEAIPVAARQIVERAEVVIHTPSTWRGLVRRRVRVAVGTSQAEREGLTGGHARTTRATMLRIVRHDPTLLADSLIFAGTAVLARAAARRQIRKGDFETWQRDDSSRAGSAPV